MNKILSIALLAAFAVSSQASIWDQAVDAGSTGFVNQEFGDFPDFSTYIVSDVHFAYAVNITGVSVWMTNAYGSWAGGVNTARLNIFSKSGTLPGGGDDPTVGGLVGATFSNVDGELNASGLNINLAAGDYWVGLTAIADFGALGQEFQLGTAAPYGDNSAARNPGGGFAIGTDWVDAGQTFGGLDWDGSIRIDGAPVPEPASMAVLSLGAAALLRRRRKA